MHGVLLVQSNLAMVNDYLWVKTILILVTAIFFGARIDSPIQFEHRLYSSRYIRYRYDFGQYVPTKAIQGAESLLPDD